MEPEEPAEGRSGLAEQVRDALRHLYDYSHLQTHALARFVRAAPGGDGPGAGQALSECLKDAIAALQVSPEMAASAAARRGRLLALRYREEQEAPAVRRVLAISRSTYQREHAAALEAVTSLLRQRWRLDAAPDAEGRPRRPLPEFLTSFIGRERELADVEALLATARLVTLSGPPGTGKTRLACAVAARRQAAYADGVCFVSLAAAGAVRDVLPALAQALGLREAGGVPLPTSLQAELGPRHLLLVLDTFEHVLAAAPLVADLLRAAPRLAVLATSRAPLHISGEHDYLVPPLALPASGRAGPAAECAAVDAIQLFAQRARAAWPAFQLSDANAAAVVAICQRLDGLPLAIELAAARLRFLPASALLARLDRRLPLLTGGPRDQPARQQTLRAAIDWSFDLLDAQQQQLFRRLATFSGGWTLEAAEAVCNDEGPPLDIIGGMAALVDQRLVQRDERRGDEARFLLLESIREYALERLAASGEAARLLRRHARYFLGLADADGSPPDLLDTHGQAAWLARLAAEHDNLRAALRWCEAQPDAEEGLRLAAALAPFWLGGDHWSEGRYWLDRTLARPRGAANTPAEAAARQAAGVFALAQGDLPSARAHLQRSAATWRERGDRAHLAAALGALATVGIRSHDHAARSAATESLALFQALGDRRGAAAVQLQLGAIATYAGDHAEAMALLAESRAFWLSAGEALPVALADWRLGALAMAGRDYAAARARLEASLVAFRACREQRGIYRQGLAIVLTQLGELDDQAGDTGSAERRCQEALALARELGDKGTAAWALKDLGRIARHQGDERRAAALFRDALRLRREQGQQRAIAACLCELAEGALRLGRLPRAVRLFAAAEPDPATPAADAAAGDLAGYAAAERVRHLNALRAALGDGPFAAAWADGLARSPAQALDEALADDLPAPADAPAAPAAGPPLAALSRRERDVAGLPPA